MSELVEILEEKFQEMGIPEETEHTFLKNWLEILGKDKVLGQLGLP